MKIEKIAALFILMLSLCFSAYAWDDWAKLHEKADKLSLEQALKISSGSGGTLKDLYVVGLIYLNLYDYSGAENTFRALAASNSNIIEAQWGIGELFRRRHKLTKAEAIFTEIIKKNPEFSPAYISLAYIQYIKMNFNKAARLAYKVIRQGKDKVDLTNYVRALSLFGGVKGMIAHYGGPISKVINGRQVMPYLKKAQKLQPNSAAVLFGFGSYYFLIPRIFGRDLDKARMYLEKAIKVDPNFSDVYVRLAQVYRAKGNENKYQEYIKKALELDPGNELALDISSGKCKFICAP